MLNERTDFQDKIKNLEEQVKGYKNKFNKFENENLKNTKDISNLIIEKIILNIELNEEREKLAPTLTTIPNNVKLNNLKFVTEDKYDKFETKYH